MKIPNDVRRAIYKRDGYQCALCSCGRFLQVHHYIPRGQGGGNNHHNLITLCSTCHAQAHECLVDEWMEPNFTEQAIVEYLADYYAPDWYPYEY